MNTQITKQERRWHWTVTDDDGNLFGSSQLVGGYKTKAEAKAEGKAAAERAWYHVVEYEGVYAVECGDEVVSIHPDQHEAARAVDEALG